jgi:hypothetical protein
LFTGYRDRFDKFPAVPAFTRLVGIVRGDGFRISGIGVSPGGRFIGAGILQRVVEVQNDADVAIAPVTVVISPVMVMTVSAIMGRGEMVARVRIIAAIKTVKPVGTVILAEVTTIA